jgi:hypothetical protein
MTILPQFVLSVIFDYWPLILLLIERALSDYLVSNTT